MFENIKQKINEFAGKIIQKNEEVPNLSDEQVAILVENISAFFTQRKRGAYLLTNVADNNQLISDGVMETVKTRNKELVIIPVQIKLGGRNNRLSVALIEEMKKNLTEQPDMKNNLDDTFWKKMEDSLNEAKQTRRKIDEQTIENLKQWISSASLSSEQGINVKANLGVSQVFSVSPGINFTNQQSTDTKVVISESDKHRQVQEIEINNWDEIKSLNDLHQLIDDVGKATVLFYYDLVETARQILQDPDVRKLKKWFDELSKNLGCLGCIFAPVIFVFEVGIELATFFLWVIKPLYYLLRIIAKRMPMFKVNITGKRKPRILFIIDGVEGSNFADDVSILTLKSLFRNLNAMFLVFMDERIYDKYFSL